MVEKTEAKKEKSDQERILACALASTQKELPNFLDLIHKKPRGYKGKPSEIHPAFYGGFDWHSCVHSYWAVVAVVKRFPDLPQVPDALKVLQSHLTAANIAVEQKSAKGYLLEWEIPYGFSWFLMLAAELQTWDNETGKTCAAALKPLELVILKILTQWMNSLKVPEIAGMHENTSFAFIMLHEYAEKVKNAGLLKKIVDLSTKFYENHKDFADGVPDENFLSPSLTILHLMSKVKSNEEFVLWLKGRPWESVLKLEPVMGDCMDGMKSHLIGLNFSRSWSFTALSKILVERKSDLLLLDTKHYNASMCCLPTGGWMADHWIASFAMLSFILKP